MFGLFSQKRRLYSQVFGNLEYVSKSDEWKTKFQLPNQKRAITFSIRSLNETELSRYEEFFQNFLKQSQNIKEKVLKLASSQVSEISSCKVKDLEFISFQAYRDSNEGKLLATIIIEEVNTDYLGGHWLVFTLDEAGNLPHGVGIEG